MTTPVETGSHPESTEQTSDVLTPATALTSVIGTTLGPNGMDKMLVGSDGKVVVTNDGANILDQIDIDDPIGNVIKHAADSQNTQVGDGTTTMVLLIGELLETADSLLDDGLHPTTIIDGYREAATVAQQALQDHTIEVTQETKISLVDIAKSAVTGRWDAESTHRFGELAVSALHTVDFDRSRLTVRSYAGGELRDSECVDGILVDMDSSSTSIDSIRTPNLDTQGQPNIVMIDDELGVDVPDGVETATISDPTQLSRFREHEEETRSEIVRTLRELETDVVICQKSIDETVRSRLLQHGILSVERTRQDEFDTIAKATGSTPVRSIDELSATAVGRGGSVERRAIGTADILAISGSPQAMRTSLLLRGGTPHVATEIKRIVNDCFDVIQLVQDERRALPGGGAAAFTTSRTLSTYADSVSDKTQLAIDAYADALEGVPRTLASNAGCDPIDVLSTLRRSHHDDDTTMGVGHDGRPREMVTAGVVEPYSVLASALAGATEVVSTVLRIDDILAVDEAAATATPEHVEAEQPPVQSDVGGYPWAIGH